MTGGPYTLDPAYTDEDLEIVVTVDGDDDLSGWTFSFRLWRPTGVEVLTGLAVAVTDVQAREVTASVTGLTLVPGAYRWSVRRTDPGSRTVSAWGVLVIADERP